MDLSRGSVTQTTHTMVCRCGARSVPMSMLSQWSIAELNLSRSTHRITRCRRSFLVEPAQGWNLLISVEPNHLSHVGIRTLRRGYLWNAPIQGIKILYTLCRACSPDSSGWRRNESFIMSLFVLHNSPRRRIHTDVFGLWNCSSETHPLNYVQQP